MSFANNLTSSDYWNLYWIIRLGAMWSRYWNEIKDRITKCFSGVLMSYKWEIEFYYCGSKIRDLTWNLRQNHSSFCDTINMCTINNQPAITCRTWCEICSKLTIETPERRHLVLVFLFLTLSRSIPTGFVCIYQPCFQSLSAFR